MFLVIQVLCLISIITGIHFSTATPCRSHYDCATAREVGT